jgi:hypothetical protein
VREEQPGERKRFPGFFVESKVSALRKSPPCVLGQAWATILLNIMRLVCGLTIALWLSLPSAGIACPQQEPASAANPAAQPPDSTAAPVEKTVPGTTPAAEQRTPENIAPEKTHTAASGTTSPTRSRKRRSHTPAQVSDGGPRKIVVREGGASEPAAQIAPGMTEAEATRQRQDTDQWLVAADQKLRLLAGRTLDAQQQETVGQIHNYMDSARLALKGGDVRRANTLAEKAHLLADDLAKH